MSTPAIRCSGRSDFLRRMEAQLERLHRREIEGPVALMLAELDAFDLINDWYGFREVDALMARMHAKLTEQLALLKDSREGGYVLGSFSRGRVALALFGDLAAASATLAESLRSLLQGTYILDGRPRTVTLSVGCTRPEILPQLDQLLAVARAGLQAALESGGDRVEISERDGLACHARTCLLGRDLQLAVAHGQLRLEYQPIFNLERMTVEGLEALLRWDHPVLGLVSPGDFIPIAARSGYLGALGDWVLENACHDFARLCRDSPLRDLRFVSVNVSRQNLGDRSLQAKVLAALAASGMEPGQLHLEITESELARNHQQAVVTVRAIRGLGVRVAIDDFGVGYSSLASLHQFPVDMLKLDRSFLLRDFTGHQGRGFLAVAHAIVSMARNVELDVVAEGVEMLEQIALLQSMQCPLAQGYYLCRPMPVEALLKYRGVVFEGIADIHRPWASGSLVQ
jgi:EAL domain-containing protein (putative c-di-GMP-specific phosphodiesterase class I)/GGDEF domain-containing protein